MKPTAPQFPVRHGLWRLIDIGGALALAYILFNLYQQNNQDPADYMVVDDVVVSDHVVGDNPPVLYDPTILRPFWASWSAKLYPANLAKTVCQGRGRTFYEPQDDIGETNLIRFMGGSDCLLLPGTYLIRYSWVLDNGTVIRSTSNTFRVVETMAELDILADPPIPPASPAVPLGPLLLLPETREEVNTNGKFQ